MARPPTRSRSTRPLAPLALAAAFVLLAAACGGGGADTGAQPAAAPADGEAQAVGPAAPGADGPLPAVDVVDVESGATVSLTSYNTGQRPLLVWFWAPH
jgi:hypothetical protein